jgi:hypothetical protein
MTDQNVKIPAPEREQAARVEPPTQGDANAPLFHDDEGRGFRTRWEGIQTGFVDEPRTAVEQADALVSEMIKRLSDVFAEERAGLEQHWGRGENVSTEDLRIALKRYRSFFERLLHV